MAPLNQDCIDVIVEFAAVSVQALAQLRLLGLGFETALRNLCTMTHRQSGERLDTLNRASLLPLVDLVFGAQPSPRLGSQLCTLMALVRGGSLTRVSAVDISFTRGECEAFLAAVASRCHALTELDVSGQPDLGDEGLCDVANVRSGGLRTLNLRGSVISDVCLGALTAHGAQLTTLEIGGKEQPLSNAGLRAVARGCRQLVALNVTYDSGGRLDLGLLGKRCRQLRHVTLRHTALAHRAFAGSACQARQSVEAHLEGIAEMCTASGQLESLRLECVSVGTGGGGGGVCNGNCAVDDGSLLQIAQHSPQLRSFVLHCSSVSDGGLKHLAQHCPQLEHVELACCRRISDAALFAIAEGCAGLQTIRVPGCGIGEPALLSLALYCPSLTFLDVSECKHVGDFGVRAIAKKCSMLRFVDLHGTSVTPASIEALAAHCADLRRLDVSDNTRMTAAPLPALAAGCPHIGQVLVPPPIASVEGVAEAYPFVEAVPAAAATPTPPASCPFGKKAPPAGGFGTASSANPWGGQVAVNGPGGHNPRRRNAW